MIRFACRTLVALTLAAAASAVGANPGLLMPTGDPEAQLLVALDHINSGRADAALASLTLLTRQQPDFRLAQYLYASLLDARSGRASLALDDADTGTAVAALMDEARQRWAHRLGRDGGRVPQSLLMLPDDRRHAIVVDLGASRLYVLARDGDRWQLVRDHYASIGRAGIGKQVEGDGRTPVGVYRVTEHLDGDNLPDLYGAGAYPVNYPNGWDLRHQRTGHGIWVHGVPSNTFSRAPLASEGCVAVANPDFASLAPFVEPGVTPVLFVDSINWVSQDDNRLLAAALRDRVMQWRADWESLDTEAYLAHYAADFATDDMDRAAFADHKRRVNAAKQFVQVELDDMELYRYPGVDDLVFLARFRQHYISDSFSAISTKEQYWRLTNDGRWEIVQEGS